MDLYPFLHTAGSKYLIFPSICLNTVDNYHQYVEILAIYSLYLGAISQKLIMFLIKNVFLKYISQNFKNVT